MTKRIIALLLAATALTTTTAMAQSQLEEIVVTANKREQNLLDVSAAVSVISSEQVREFGGQDVAQLATRIVGLQVQEYDLFPAFFMRGVGLTTETNDLNDQPVGTYLDEVYLGAPSLSRGQLFDVERIEVLRGPQGTLFGRNTSAGLVHYITKAPTAETDGYAQLTVGSFGRIVGEGAIGGALGEHARARISAKYINDNGWQRDVLTGQRFAANDIFSVRGQLAIDATENFEVLTKVEYAKQDNTGARYSLSGLFDPALLSRPCSLERVNAQQCAATNGFREPDLDPRRVATDDPPADDLETTGVTGRISYTGDAVNLTSITAYRSLTRSWIADGDSTPLAFAGGAIRFRTFRTTDSEQFSQEVRFDGSTEALNWVAGAYYYDDSRDFLTSFPLVGAGNKTVSELKTKSAAGFGQVDYRLTDQFTAVGGVRYSHERRSINQVLTANLGNPAVTITDAETTRDSKWTGRATLEYRPNNNAMLYAGVSTGFKSGTFAQSLNAARGIDQVAPEKARTFEAGWKQQYMNGLAQTTIAVYNNRYRDFQATGSGTDPRTGVPINLLSNVGSMEANGLEAEASIRPIDQLQVNLGFTYTDTEISSTQNSGDRDPETNALYFYDGNPAPSTPKTRLNGSVRWMAPESAVGTFGAQASFNWQSKVNFQANANRYLRQDAYATADVTGIWEAPGGQYYGQVFVQNVTDEEVAGWQFLITFVGSRSTAWGMPPRTFGARLGVRL